MEELDYPTGLSRPAAAGALAASLLAEAFRDTSEAENLLQKEVVLELAEDIEGELEVLAYPAPGASPSPGLLAEAALRCADLANLAASNAAVLPPPKTAKAVAATHLAAGAARALYALHETTTAEECTGETFRDVRSASWRAGLAARQADELLGV